jgi:hypothetical protein
MVFVSGRKTLPFHIYKPRAVSEEDGSTRSGSIEARCFRGRGTATGSGRRGCAHVGKGLRGGSSIAGSLMQDVLEGQAHRAADSMLPWWKADPMLSVRCHQAGGNTWYSHRYERPYSNFQHQVGCLGWGRFFSLTRRATRLRFRFPHPPHSGQPLRVPLNEVQ